MIKVLLSRLTLVLVVVLLEIRCEARNIGNNSLKQFGSYENGDSSCKCHEVFCECCTIVGPSNMCNMIKLVTVGNEQNPALELSVSIGRSKIFSQNISLRELEPICYPYGDYNLCVQVDHKKIKEDNVQVCGNFLAKHKAYNKIEESILIKTQLFCLPNETHQINKHVLQLLRFVSQ